MGNVRIPIDAVTLTTLVYFQYSFLIFSTIMLFITKILLCHIFLICFNAALCFLSTYFFSSTCLFIRKLVQVPSPVKLPLFAFEVGGLVFAQIGRNTAGIGTLAHPYAATLSMMTSTINT